MGKLNIFEQIIRLRKVRECLEKNEELWLEKLSLETGMSKTTLSRILKKYFVVNKRINGKRKIIHLRVKKVSKEEKKCYRRGNAMLKAVELRIKGFSLSEISKKIESEFIGVKFDSATLSINLRNVKISKEGEKRLGNKIRKDRQNASIISLKRQREVGILGKNQPLATKKAAEINTKKLSFSSYKLTKEKVKVIGHCLFNGSVSQINGYNVVSYCSKVKNQVEDFSQTVEKVYKLKTKINKRDGEVYYCRFCSKELVKDLLRYTPEYSSKANSKAKIPEEILNAPKEYKREFLKTFWDDEGAICIGVNKDSLGYVHSSRALEAYCENDKIRKGLLRLHYDLKIPTRLANKKIIISTIKGFKAFRNNIGFSGYVKVSFKKSIFYGIQKQKILDYVIKTLDKKRLKIWVKTYGCAANKADSELIKGFLFKMDTKLVNSEKEADVVIINSCGVKQPTENKVVKFANELSKDKSVIIGGCLPEMVGDIKDKTPRVRGYFSNNTIPGVVEKILDICSNRENIVSDTILSENYISIPRIRENDIIAPIIIAKGCRGKCSYCSVKIARGNLSSIPKEGIIQDIKVALLQGAKEIWLTAQDTGAYGFDIGENLPSLLKKVTDIPGKFLVRVGMMNPNHVIGFLDELIDTYKSEKIYKFLHIPVQSGDNGVLKDMRRQYKVKDFEDIVKRFRESIPEITISTDVIVGYPTETEKEFQNTLELIKRTEPDVLNISRYWERKGTLSEKLKELPGRETKRRSRIVNDLFKGISLKRNERWINREVGVLVSEKGKKGNNNYCARNSSYKPIILNSNDSSLLGKFAKVRIESATYYDLRGIVVKNINTMLTCH